MTSTVPSEEVVRYRATDVAVTIELNRPHRLNAVTDDVVRALSAAFERAAIESAPVVVLTGAGRAFCSGHDLTAVVDDVDQAARRARLDRLQDVTRAIKNSLCPVVAAVEGWAVGAGAELAFACDLVVAGRNATFRFPEVSVGLAVTNGITQILAAVMGPQRAKHLLMTGAPFPATDAATWGLVSTVVDDGDALESAHDIAASLAAQPPVALSLAKRAVDRGLGASLEEALVEEVEISLLLDADEHTPRATSGSR